MTEITDSYEQLTDNPTIIDATNLTVIVGQNNSGKSTILRGILKSRGDSYLVNIDRTILKGEGAQNRDYIANIDSYVNQIRDANDDNILNKPTQILQELFSLKTVDRAKIIDYYNKHFPNQAIVVQEDAENDASPHILSMNGFSITKQGSGARAILEILVKLFDPKINVLCIDEPEIALEPKLQKKLFVAISNMTTTKQIFIATHSHHFLDNDVLTNNYICSRDENNKIFLTQVTTELELRNIRFNLLGNDLKDFGLPDSLIIAEGITDSKYFTKCLKLLDKQGYTLFDAGSDSKLGKAAEGISEYLRFTSDLASVYKDKIWIISDVQKSGSTRAREWRVVLNDTDGSKGKVTTLSKNGI